MHVEERVGNTQRDTVMDRQSKEKHAEGKWDREMTDTLTQRGQFKWFSSSFS